MRLIASIVPEREHRLELAYGLAGHPPWVKPASIKRRGSSRRFCIRGLVSGAAHRGGAEWKKAPLFPAGPPSLIRSAGFLVAARPAAAAVTTTVATFTLWTAAGVI